MSIKHGFWLKDDSRAHYCGAYCGSCEKDLEKTYIGVANPCCETGGIGFCLDCIKEAYKLTEFDKEDGE